MFCSRGVLIDAPLNGDVHENGACVDDDVFDAMNALFTRSFRERENCDRRGASTRPGPSAAVWGKGNAACLADVAGGVEGVFSLDASFERPANESGPGRLLNHLVSLSVPGFSGEPSAAAGAAVAAAAGWLLRLKIGIVRAGTMSHRLIGAKSVLGRLGIQVTQEKDRQAGVVEGRGSSRHTLKHSMNVRDRVNHTLVTVAHCPRRW